MSSLATELPVGELSYALREEENGDRTIMVVCFLLNCHKVLNVILYNSLEISCSLSHSWSRQYSDLCLTLKGQEFRIRNKTIYTGKGGSSVCGTKPKTKENDVIMILFSRAYITLIRLSFCISTGERES